MSSPRATDGRGLRAPAPDRRLAPQTVVRFPSYLHRLREMEAGGETYASAAALAAEFGFDPIVVRKDLAAAGVAGIPRRGFPIRPLMAAMARLLGWDSPSEAVLCGVGNLGRALLGYHGFEQHGLVISAAFDSSPRVIGATIHGFKIRSVGTLGRYVARRRIRIAILTVPSAAAQAVADSLASAGIRGILDFTPAPLALPAAVVVQRVDIAESLALLSHNLRDFPGRATPPPRPPSTK